MDAKTYILRKVNQAYDSGDTLNSSVKNALNDSRLKIELLPPPARFEAVRDTLWVGQRWLVVDKSNIDTIGVFYDQARAIDYAKWQNSLETE